MTDTVSTPEVEAPESTEVETHVDQPEATTAPEPAPEEYKPWKQLKQPTAPAHIPYERFKSINDERVTYLTQLQQAEAELEKFRTREAELNKVKDPEDVKIEDYKTPEEYLAARDKAVLAKAQSVLRAEMQQEQAEKAKQAQLEAVGNLYQTNLNEAIKRNPEIADASAMLDQYAHHLHPAVAYELMIDENVGELIYDITTNKELLQEMFRGDPATFIRKMHKMSAKIDRDARYNKQPAARADEPMGVVPPVLDPKAKLREGLPSVPRGTTATTGARKPISEMSASEYRRYKQSQKA